MVQCFAVNLILMASQQIDFVYSVNILGALNMLN